MNIKEWIKNNKTPATIIIIGLLCIIWMVFEMDGGVNEVNTCFKDIGLIQCPDNFKWADPHQTLLGGTTVPGFYCLEKGNRSTPTQSVKYYFLDEEIDRCESHIIKRGIL